MKGVLQKIKLSDIDPNKVPEPFKAVVDLSSSHLTENDYEILDNICAGISTESSANVIGKFEYGYFLCTHVDDGVGELLLRQGFSKHLVIILTDLWYKNIYYVCFDECGDILDGYPTFDW